MQKRYLPAALVLAVLLALLAVLGVRAPEAAPTIGVYGAEKKVYLTFDDGPSTAVTNSVLDTLKREGVPATFFIVSDRAYNREDTLRRIAAEGHTLGVHSASHVYSKIYASDESFLSDVDTCANVIARVTGITPHVYRFPGGGRHERQAKLLKERGYKIVGWNAVCGDEEIPKADATRLLQETCRTSEGKSTVVLLMHDSARHAETARALPGIIEWYRSQGYVFCQY